MERVRASKVGGGKRAGGGGGGELAPSPQPDRALPSIRSADRAGAVLVVAVQRGKRKEWGEGRVHPPPRPQPGPPFRSGWGPIRVGTLPLAPHSDRRIANRCAERARCAAAGPRAAIRRAGPGSPPFHRRTARARGPKGRRAARETQGVASTVRKRKRCPNKSMPAGGRPCGRARGRENEVGGCESGRERGEEGARGAGREGRRA